MGIIILTLGIALTIQSKLGASPFDALSHRIIPYVWSIDWELGNRSGFFDERIQLHC
ncbi:hypothetical protein [Pontibacillus halophilus]|uniref:hypothetical protein n=1 Tax=Pontibacillus halophilus TaxID=516704 RepID=UPI0038B3DF7A